MKSLKTVLRPYVRQVKLGEEETSFQAEKLKTDLQKLRKSKNQTFFVCVGMIILAFLISIGIVLVLLHDPDKIAVLFSATGLTTAGLISAMRGLWKESVAIDLTIALLESMRPESFESILPIIMKKF